jgi:DNA-binding transcriptional LysR family regulator
MTPTMRRDIKVSIERQPVLGNLLSKIGQDINVKVRLPYFSPIGPIVANTNLIATLPLQVARRLRNSRTRVVPAPKEIGVHFDYHQVWRSDDDSDPMHGWIRALMRTLCRRVIRDLRSLSHPSESQKQILGLH